MENFEDVIKRVKETINTPFGTDTFGDDWKNQVRGTTPLYDIIEIAWYQGRKAILLERELKKLLPK